VAADTGKPTLAAFISARLDEEEPSEICGCFDVNHWPPCSPQPWKDRKRREIAAMRAVVADYEASVRSVGEGLSVARRHLTLAVAAIWEDHPDYRAGGDWAS
jgi:hypothetical protein